MNLKKTHKIVITYVTQITVIKNGVAGLEIEIFQMAYPFYCPVNSFQN